VLLNFFITDKTDTQLFYSLENHMFWKPDMIGHYGNTSRISEREIS